MAFKVFCVLLLIGCAIADEIQPPAPCAVEDLACYNKARNEINEKTAAGIPKYGVKAFDPLIIPTFEYNSDDGFKVDFTNLKITGFKNLEVTAMKLDRAAKEGTYTAKYNLKIEDEDFHVHFDKENKKFVGKYEASTGVLLTGTYNYELKADEKGEDHLKIVSGSFKCDLFDVNVTKDAKLEEAITNDPILGKDLYTEEERTAFDKDLLCKIILKGYETVSYNYKIANDYYPVKTFFTNF